MVSGGPTGTEPNIYNPPLLYESPSKTRTMVGVLDDYDMDSDVRMSGQVSHSRQTYVTERHKSQPFEDLGTGEIPFISDFSCAPFLAAEGDSGGPVYVRRPGKGRPALAVGMLSFNRFTTAPDGSQVPLDTCWHDISSIRSDTGVDLLTAPASSSP